MVLYGSQKGQAQSIAEGIAEEAEDHGLVAELSCLNQDEKVTSIITHIHFKIAQLLTCNSVINTFFLLVVPVFPHGSNLFQYNLEKEIAPVVFVVSTTGDGEPPDNALQFVKRIKKIRSPDHYKHLSYTLLGTF